MIVDGVDPSLTATGVAVVDTDDVLSIRVDSVGGKGHRDASWFDRWRRVEDLAGRVIGVFGGCADLVVIEAPSLAQRNAGSAHDRAGLWWSLFGRLARAEVPVLPVPPAVRAKYATGKGNAPKDAVMLAVARRYPQAPVATNDHADAVALAAIGARMLGEPVEGSLPKTHLDALAKLTLPGHRRAT